MRIAADGTQNETFGGDGVFTQVRPARTPTTSSRRPPDAGRTVSTDGGVNWTDVNPLVDNASFYAPAGHGPEGPRTTSSPAASRSSRRPTGPTSPPPRRPHGTDRLEDGDEPRQVQDGRRQPGVGHRRARPRRLRGLLRQLRRRRQRAKVLLGAGDQRGRQESPRNRAPAHGWHTVKAKGLPQRLHRQRHDRSPQHQDDLRDPRRLRPAPVRRAPRPQEATRASRPVAGHIYKSTNGGRSFHDISANLRKLPALWSMVHGHHLVVATTNGVYASRGRNGGHYALLGRGLPAAPVFSLSSVSGSPAPARSPPASAAASTVTRSLRAADRRPSRPPRSLLALRRPSGGRTKSRPTSLPR